MDGCSRRAAAGLLALAVGLPACGGESDAEAVERAVKTYTGATADGDAQRACAQVAPGFGGSRTCEDIVRFNFDNAYGREAARRQAAGPYDVRIDGDSAVAEGQNLGIFTLKKIGDDWKISDVR